MILTLRTAWSLITFLTLAFILTSASAAIPTSSIIDVGIFNQYEMGGGLIEIITTLDPEDNQVLKRASTIIKTKLAGSTPLEDAAAKLIQSCKTAESQGIHSSSIGSIKDAAKQTYAIKATLHSLSTAGEPLPSACEVLSGRRRTSWFSSSLFSPRADSATPGANEVHQVCLGQLWRIGTAWTSYTSHLQDANSLCEVASVEHAPRLLLDLLNDVSELVPGLFEMLKRQEAQHASALEKQREHQERVSALQAEHIQDAKDHHTAVKALASDVLEQTRRHVQGMTGQLRNDIMAAGGDIEEIKRLMKGAVDEFSIVRETGVAIFDQYQSTFGDVTALQARRMNEIEDNFLSIIRTMNEVHGGLSEQWIAHFEVVRAGMQQIAKSQSDVMETQTISKNLAIQNLDLQDAQLQKLEDAAAVTDVLTTKLELLTVFLNLKVVMGMVGMLSAICMLRFCGFGRTAAFVTYFQGILWPMVYLSKHLSFTKVDVQSGMSSAIEAIKMFTSEHAWLAFEAVMVFTMIVLVVTGVALSVGTLLQRRRTRETDEEIQYKIARSQRAQTCAPQSLRHGAGKGKPRVDVQSLIDYSKQTAPRVSKRSRV